jgi:hypothetical protein
MTKGYLITVYDGSGPPVQVAVSRPRLSAMIGQAFLQAALAGDQIEEGAGGPELVLREPVELPDSLLTTPPPR